MTLDLLAWASFLVFLVALVHTVRTRGNTEWTLLTAWAVADFFLVGAVRGLVQ